MKTDNLNNINFIDSTSFKLLNNNEIEKLSIKNITNEQKKDILNDVSLGPELGQNCSICGLSYKLCIGHFSHLNDLNCFKSLFLKEVIRVLNNICSNCYNFRDKKTIKYCYYCNQKVKSVFSIKFVNKIITINKKIIGDNKDILNTNVKFESIKYILNSINKDTAIKLGYINGTHPRDLIWNNYIIIPKNYRRLNLVNGRLLKNNIGNIYYQLLKLIKIRNEYTDTDKINNINNKIQLLEMAMVNGEKYSLSILKMNTILPQLTKKEGIIINDLITRRVVNAIRSIIIPAPPSEIKIDEVGIPEYLASKIYLYDIVGYNNIEKLNSLLFNNSYPKIISKLIKNSDGSIYENKILQKDRLVIGDKIKRTLMDEDIVTVNRQPTLTKGSILGFKVKLTKNKSLSLNTTSTKIFAADFDGDAMNVIVPLHYDVRTEIKTLMMSNNNLISSATGQLITSIIQDHTAMLYILTDSKFFLQKEYKNIILENCNIYNKNIKLYEENYNGVIIKYYKGRDIFSLLIPEGFNYIKNFSDKENFIINDGMLISGRIDKSIIMAGQRGLITSYIDYYGYDLTTNLINNLMVISENLMKVYCLTASCRDFYFEKEDMSLIRAEREVKYANFYELINKFNIIDEDVEKLITIELQKISSRCEIINEKIKNGYYQFCNIIESGAKGDYNNIYKCCYTIGQITIGSNRYSDNLTHVSLSDKISKYGLGIIETPYLEGLNSSEVQIGNENAIFSLTQQQVETAGPGYINKQISEVVKNFNYYSDYTIRYYNGKILVPHFFNSFDVVKEQIYKIKFEKEKYLFDNINMSSKYGINTEKELYKYNNYIKSFVNLFYYFNKKLDIYADSYNFELLLPFDFNLIIINNINSDKEYTPNKDAYKNILDIFKMIEDVLNSYTTSLFKELDNINKYVLCFGLIYYLHPINISLTKDEYIKILNIIKNNIINAQVYPGHPLLLEAGTSATSSATQSLLSAIHSLTGGDSAYKILRSNLNITKDNKNQNSLITTYVDKSLKNKQFIQIIFNQLVDKVEVKYIKYYKTNNEKNSLIIKNNSRNQIKSILLFSYYLNQNELVENHLLTPYIFFKIYEYYLTTIDNEQLKNIIIYFEIEQEPFKNIIHLKIDGYFNNIRDVINIVNTNTINIRLKEILFNKITIDQLSRDDKNYKCVIKNLEYEDALKLNFINKDYILTSSLYSVYLKYGNIGYYTSTINNFKNIFIISQKYSYLLGLVMIFNPKLIPFTRQGLAKLSNNKWDLISFESQETNLINATLSQSFCDNKSLSSQFIYGISPKVGTGSVKLEFNIDKLNSLFPSYKLSKNNKTLNTTYLMKKENLI